MVRCPSCGASSLFRLHLEQCGFCGRIFCDRCVPVLIEPMQMKVTMETASTAATYTTVSFCSGGCANKFWQRVIDYQVDYDIGTDVENFNSTIIFAWNNAINNAFVLGGMPFLQSFIPMARNAIKLHSRSFPAFPWLDHQHNYILAYKNFKAKARNALAENLEKCGRTSDAAKIFEELRMYDKARELREKDRHIIVKKTDISLNLNSLLQQVKEGGIVAVFRCPHCGGKLKIGDKTTLNSLKTCEHCGSEIESMDLAEFLKTALS